MLAEPLIITRAEAVLRARGQVRLGAQGRAYMEVFKFPRTGRPLPYDDRGWADLGEFMSLTQPQ